MHLLFIASLYLAQTPAQLPPIPTTEESYANADQPQAASINGNALFGAKDTEGLIAKAKAAAAAAPNDAEKLLALGRAQDGLLRFQEAVGTYSIGIGKFPGDYRFFAKRGQRLISLRKFGEAIPDLELAAKIVPTSFDAAYYLGLAYYFSGEHEKAAAELARCESQMKTPLETKTETMGGRSCEGMRDDANFLVALQHWRYLALRRSGETAAAKKYLDKEVSPLLTIEVTKPFYDALLFFKGIKDINEMMIGGNESSRDYLTRSSGAATFLFTEGERAKACQLWQRNAMDSTNWDHLGVINSESEYWQNSKAACLLYGAPQKQP